MLTQEIVREQLDYNELSGALRWRIRKSRIHFGMLAGHRTPEGYVRVTIDGHRYMAHTVIWLWMTGEWLPRGVDHIDTDGTNNRWSNLRRCTNSQNNWNTKLRSDNKIGFKGVTFRKECPQNPYVATITIGDKQKTLGYFSTPEEAHAAYAAAARDHFGDFARVA